MRARELLTQTTCSVGCLWWLARCPHDRSPARWMHGLCKGRPPALGASRLDRPSRRRSPAAGPAAQPAATGSPAERWVNNVDLGKHKQFYLTFLRQSLVQTRTNPGPWHQLAVLVMIHGFPQFCFHSWMFILFWKGSSKKWEQGHEWKIAEVNRLNGNGWKSSLNST